MNRIIAFLTLMILTACNNKTEDKATDIKTKQSKSSTIDRDKLDYYFDQYEIKPLISANNIDGNQTEIQLSNHKIKWLNTDDETKITIDNDLFTLKDKATLNIVWDNKDSVDFSNNWDEVKLYRINDQELIGIRMSFQPCTGLGCSVDYFLIYDLKTKKKGCVLKCMMEVKVGKESSGVPQLCDCEVRQSAGVSPLLWDEDSAQWQEGKWPSELFVQRVW